jgi:hypothetical protein
LGRCFSCGSGSFAQQRGCRALKQAADLWPSLAFDGIQADGRGGLTELRRCPCCGSTIGRPTTKEQAEALLARVESVYAISRANLQAA